MQRKYDCMYFSCPLCLYCFPNLSPTFISLFNFHFFSSFLLICVFVLRQDLTIWLCLAWSSVFLQTKRSTYLCLFLSAVIKVGPTTPDLPLCLFFFLFSHSTILPLLFISSSHTSPHLPSVTLSVW